MKIEKKYFLWIGLLIIFIVIISNYQNILKFGDSENIESMIAVFGGFGIVVFGILYYILTLFLFPASLLTVFAGVLFGKFFGTVIVVISATLAACTAFVIGRYFGKDLSSKLSRKKKLHFLIEKIEKQVKNNGFQAFFIMRCLFLPYMPFSYAAGCVRTAQLKDFLLGTFVTNIIFSFMFVYLGDNLLKGPKALILPVFLVILALQAPKIVKMLKIK